MGHGERKRLKLPHRTFVVVVWYEARPFIRDRVMRQVTEGRSVQPLTLWPGRGGREGKTELILNLLRRTLPPLACVSFYVHREKMLSFYTKTTSHFNFFLFFFVHQKGSARKGRVQLLRPRKFLKHIWRTKGRTLPFIVRAVLHYRMGGAPFLLGSRNLGR